MNMFIKIMPKLIPNAKEQILSVAKEELRNPEGGSFSMRSVAKKCHMAVGTLYNYFPDKINLIAGILLAEWKDEYQKTEDRISELSDVRDVLSAIAELITRFRTKNNSVFLTYRDGSFGLYYVRLHGMFVQQIENLWKKGTASYGLDGEKNRMIAEMILIQTKDKEISFETLCSMITDIIRR